MNWRGQTVIVTGGAGFIGSALVRRLAQEGALVRVIDSLWRGKLSNLRSDSGAQIIDVETQFIQADLTDPAAASAAIRDANWVFHLADIVAGVDFVFGNEPFVFRQNTLMNTNTLGAVWAAKIPNYVYVGTACSYPRHLQMAPGVVALREDQAYPAEPESSYGWSKLMGEYEAELAERSGRINVGLLRLHNVYGPRVSFEPERSQVLPALCRKAILYPKEGYRVWGSGEQYRDFVYVDDVVSALLLVAEKGMSRGLIQIGSERAVTIREAAHLIAGLSGRAIDVIFDETKPEGDRGRIAVCERARRLLGWHPTVSFEDGIRRTYDWIKAELAGRSPNARA